MKLLAVAILAIYTLFFAAPAFAQEKLLVVGGWDYGEAVFARAATEVGMSAQFVTTEQTGDVTVEQLQAADVVFLLNLKPQGCVVLQQRLAEAEAAKPSLKVLPLAERATQNAIEKAGLLMRDPAVSDYWRYNGLENTKRMLQYVRVKHLGGSGDSNREVQPPVEVPNHGVYHTNATELFTEVPAFIQWATQNGHFDSTRPRIAILVQQSFLITGDTKTYAALLDAFEKRGINAVVIFGHDPATQKALLDAWQPELLIDDAHASPSIKEGSEHRDIPILKCVELLRSTTAEWEASPQGMLPADVGLHFLSQEVYGIIDPVVVAGLKANVGGYKLHEPIPDRVDRIADRAVAWLNLRHKQNADKKVAIVYYNPYLGKSDVARGSATGAFLDAPESLFRLLTRMKDDGYMFSRFPKDRDQMLSWMRERGRNIGVWASGDLSDLVRDGSPVLIPSLHYSQWFDELSDANRKFVIDAYGAVPGSQMVWGAGDKASLVLPRIDLGNVILMPQPARGPENDVKLLHSKDVPPPHQYLAFYWWLQREFRADAVIHFGTHGTEFLLPGKANGLSKDCFGDICLGNMPNIYPWIIDNLAEAIQAKRRGYAITVDHLTPPLEAAGLSPDMQNLHGDIEKFVTLEEGLLKQKYRKSISDAARENALTRSSELLTDAAIEQIELQLHEIELSVAAMKLHVLGVEPESKHLIPFLASMLGHQYLESLASVLPVPAEVAAEPEHVALWVRPQLEAIVRQIVEEDLTPAEALQLAGAKLLRSDPEHVLETLELIVSYRESIATTGVELDNILRGLDGRFISPGPGADPVRNPGAIPTGRNIYSLNPEEIPTKQAWEVGMQLVNQLLEQNPDLKKVAFDMNAFETMRDYGVTEAQALYLMGVKPVWDQNHLAVDVDVIPRDELGRPRVDVFISIGGKMRDNFSSRVKLLDKAIRLVSDLDEPDNQIKTGTDAMRAALQQRGFSQERITLLSPARIFGSKPGGYGTNILYLIPKTGAWKERSELADVFKNNMSAVFTGDVWGEEVPGLYEDAVKNTEMVLRTWTSNMTGPITNHHVNEYAGGLSLAIESVTGKQPRLMFGDVRGAPKVRDFDEVLTTEAHVTMLNPKWLRGMMENEYSGGGMMAGVVRNTAGWSATRKGSVSQEMWDAIYEVYVKDKHNLQLREFMERVNPHAFQEIAAVMLEAYRKGDWQTDAETVRGLAAEYAASVAKHGPSNGLTGGGNSKLDATVEAALEAPGQQNLLAAYQAAMTNANQVHSVDDFSETQEGEVAEQQISGVKVEVTETTANRSVDQPWWIAVAVAVVGLVGIGMWFRIGAPR